MQAEIVGDSLGSVVVARIDSVIVGIDDVILLFVHVISLVAISLVCI